MVVNLTVLLWQQATQWLKIMAEQIMEGGGHLVSAAVTELLKNCKRVLWCMIFAIPSPKTLRRMMPGSSQLSGSPSRMATALLKSHEWGLSRSCINGAHVVLSGSLKNDISFIGSVYKGNFTKADKRFTGHWRAKQKQQQKTKSSNKTGKSPVRKPLMYLSLFLRSNFKVLKNHYDFRECKLKQQTTHKGGWMVRCEQMFLIKHSSSKWHLFKNKIDLP